MIIRYLLILLLFIPISVSSNVIQDTKQHGGGGGGIALDTGSTATCVVGGSGDSTVNCNITTSAVNEVIYLEVITYAGVNQQSQVPTGGGLTWNLNYHFNFDSLGNSSPQFATLSIDEYWAFKSTAGAVSIPVSNTGINAFYFMGLAWAVSGANVSVPNEASSLVNTSSDAPGAPSISGTTTVATFIHSIAVSALFSPSNCNAGNLSQGASMTLITRSDNSTNISSDSCAIVEYKSINNAGGYTADVKGTWYTPTNTGFAIIAEGTK